MMPAPVTEAYVDVNGTVLWTATQGQGFPLVLCHGGPGGHDDLAPLSSDLADLAKTHRYDQRGCGRSARIPPYTLDGYLKDLEALRAHWGYTFWIVGGHSWGAGLALAYAITYPERVRGLVYISGTGVRTDWKEEYRQNRWARLKPEERERWIWLREQQRSVRSQGSPPHEPLDREYRQLYMYTDFADRRNAPPSQPSMPESNHEVNTLLNAEWERFVDHLDRSTLAHLTMRALVVHGDQDPRPQWAARGLADTLPNATYVELTGVGHYPHLERPYLLAREVRSFLTSLMAT